MKCGSYSLLVLWSVLQCYTKLHISARDPRVLLWAVIFTAHLLTGALNTAANVRMHSGINAVSFDLQVLTY